MPMRSVRLSGLPRERRNQGLHEPVIGRGAGIWLRVCPLFVEAGSVELEDLFAAYADLCIERLPSHRADDAIDFEPSVGLISLNCLLGCHVVEVSWPGTSPTDHNNVVSVVTAVPVE